MDDQARNSTEHVKMVCLSATNKLSIEGVGVSGLCLNILFKKYFDKDCYVTLFSRKGFSIGIWVDFPFRKGKKGLLSSFCKRTAWITRTKGLFVMRLSSPENSFLLVFGVKGLSKRTK